uniref:DNA-binding protein SATB n=1 Tax=Fopius arisanus TaxID=64838 RepID=A0A0C9QAT6_9HYME
MQASAETNSLDLQAMQSMDWLFKKERIYLLVQFWQQRATLAENEVTTLKEQLAALTDGNSKTEGQQQKSQNAQSTDTSHDQSNPRRTPNSNLEQELQAKDKEINQLVEEVSRLQQSLQRLQETSAQATARLEEELDSRRQHIVRLESKLERQRDYDELKREISVLRSVDLSQIPTGEPGKSLEHLLMERTKALQQAETLKPPSTPDALGKEQGMPTFGRPQEGGPPDMNDERIAHMLSESGHLQMSRASEHDTSNDADSKSPSRLGCPSPFGKDRYDSQNRRLKKYENDDIPQEKVVRIYHEELAKLMGRRTDDLRGPRDFPPSAMFPHFFSGAQGIQGMERTQEEIRLTLDAYHREFQKLNSASGGNAALASLSGLPSLPSLIALHQQALHQNHLAANGTGVGVQDLSLGKVDPRSKIMNGVSEEDKEKMEEAMRHAGSAFSLVRPKQEPTGAQSTPGGSSASSPLGNSILPPAMTPNEEFSGAAAASPLQRMASITNSLISQPSTPTHHSANQRPLKAVLPPITQQQFDLYNNLNTEDIVKRVKEQLSQYSISQRLFGESVLGLSQGSVSDLLARPKPWHMLTQKGREPFIRMKMFLEDEQAVHKLVASQYKIAPEKLMRTGGYGGLPRKFNSACGTPMKPMPPTKLVQEQLQNAAKAQAAAQAAAAAAAQHQEHQMQLGPPSGPQHGTHPAPPAPMMLTPPGPHHGTTHGGQLSIQELQKKQHQQQQQMGLHSPHQMTPSPLRILHSHVSPSVYELAALTQDLDTQTITTKIKEALLANNIGQKIFGEAVLGLSQGSVSELLSKPKPWHMLSIKGREPFIRMQLWLTDAHNIDRLQALKNERREANKRRRSSGPGHDNSSDTSSNDTADFYHASGSPGPGPPSAKKQRVLFSEEQKEALRLAFALDPYPNVATIEFLAGELALSSRTITNWFHNHRMRLKQQTPHGQPEPQSPREPAQPFDPVQFRLLLNQRLLEIQKERLGLGNVPIPYSPYFNPNLATLMSNALKEQCSGLDLSMGSLKREPNPEFEDDDGDDAMSNLGSEDSDGSASSIKREPNDHNQTQPTAATSVRSNRRKPAAPQWVNPEWQEPARTGDEVIINGVCVMQTDDYGVKRETEETIRVEPTPVQDRYDDDGQSDVSSVSGNNGQDRDSPMPSPKSAQNSPITSPRPPSQQNPQDNGESPKEIVKHEPEETWDY